MVMVVMMPAMVMVVMVMIPAMVMVVVMVIVPILRQFHVRVLPGLPLGARRVRRLNLSPQRN